MKASRFLVLLLLWIHACASQTTTPIPTALPTRPPTPTRAPTSTATTAPTATRAPTAASKLLWQQRAAPRTLIDANDIARIKQWIATDAWARGAFDQIIRNADAWPSGYLKEFNLTRPDLPPTGGQWTLWYICPNGLPLRYVPTHSPPHYCPSTNQYYASPPQWQNRPTLYNEVIYARRHDALATYARWLGLAYALTGDAKYATSAATILRAYAAVYPTYPHHDVNGKTSRSGAKAHAQTLDEAVWLIDLAWSYDLIGDTLAPADRAAIANGLLRPAVAEIEGNPMGLSNWQTWHNAAIATVGFALNDTRMVNEAYNDPANGFFMQLRDGASADGFWWESSWGYHFYALNAMIDLAEMGARAGIDTYAQSNLRAMWYAPLQMVLPDLTLPRFNDDTGRSLMHEWMYEVGYNRYRDPLLALPISGGARGWQALLWGAETLSAASPSMTTSALLPKAGYAILRAGDGTDLRYLAFKFGPHGGFHGHFDELGYVSFGAGKLLGIDPGTHSYASALHDGWDKTTVAHNTVVVDEQNQAEATGNLRQYLGFSAFSLATADAGAAYPNRAAITRSLALTPDYWLDVMRVMALDGKPHRIDWVYHDAGNLSTPLTLSPYTAFPKSNGYDHLTADRAAATDSDWQATWTLSGARVDLTMLGVTGTTVGAGTGIDQTNQAVPFAMARRQAQDTTFAALFEPSRTSPRVTTFASLGAGLSIVAPGVFEDSVLLPDDTAHGDRSFSVFSTDAVAAYAREDATNNLQTFVLANATRFSDGVVPRLTSTMPITLQVTYTGNTLAVTLPRAPIAQVRIYAPTSTQVRVNGNIVGYKREGVSVTITVP